ncbi:MAG: hypothetical protein V2I33_21035 [Kangiellaceae bacterium]|jgi:hypothetical protein|nr:hypothetical protein [Kangiellaceae bacterium]
MDSFDTTERASLAQLCQCRIEIFSVHASGDVKALVSDLYAPEQEIANVLLYVPLVKTSDRYGALIHGAVEAVWSDRSFSGFDEASPPFLVPRQ